ncbi:restriction endonuclease [Paenibacillus forsythiae]|uniref:restriction endonuclease n=1 Tax=Paenibacillus forsythiae TaxID=365616 RepID=UPI001E393E2C|nr:restriction endonuclease [Paenibacillus forsythiae]
MVLRLKAGKQVHGCYDAWIVTTSHFTRSAKEAAERLNIKLIIRLALDARLKCLQTALYAGDGGIVSLDGFEQITVNDIIRARNHGSLIGRKEYSQVRNILWLGKPA